MSAPVRQAAFDLKARGWAPRHGRYQDLPCSTCGAVKFDIYLDEQQRVYCREHRPGGAHPGNGSGGLPARATEAKPEQLGLGL